MRLHAENIQYTIDNIKSLTLAVERLEANTLNAADDLTMPPLAQYIGPVGEFQRWKSVDHRFILCQHVLRSLEVDIGLTYKLNTEILTQFYGP